MQEETLTRKKQVYTPHTAPKGFNECFCDLCNRVTMHYKAGDQPATCCNHSNWNGKKHVVVQKDSSHVIQMGSLGKKPHENPSEAEFRRINRISRSMVRAAEDHSPIIDADWGRNVFGENLNAPQIDPDKHYCSLCGKETPRIQLTTQKKPKIRNRIEYMKLPDGSIRAIEQRQAVAQEIKACRTCCLQVREPVIVRVV